jgi:hypothetical protein
LRTEERKKMGVGGNAGVWLCFKAVEKAEVEKVRVE